MGTLGSIWCKSKVIFNNVSCTYLKIHLHWLFWEMQTEYEVFGPPRCAKKAFKRLSYSWISYNVLMTRSSISKIRDFYISSLKQIKWFPVDLYLKPSKAHLILMLSPPYLIQRFMWINTLIWKFKLQGPLYTATLPQRENSLFSSRSSVFTVQ